MAQIVVYGHTARLRARITEFSDAIHDAATEVLELPAGKRFHRFVPLDEGWFVAPDDRTEDYTIVEVSMFEGRSVEVKKRFIRALYANVARIGIGADDLEVTITETPRHNWGIRGIPADELDLPYRVELD